MTTQQCQPNPAQPNPSPPPLFLPFCPSTFQTPSSKPPSSPIPKFPDGGRTAQGGSTGNSGVSLVAYTTNPKGLRYVMNGKPKPKREREREQLATHTQQTSLLFVLGTS